MPNHSSHTVLFQELNVPKSTDVTLNNFESYNGGQWIVFLNSSVYVQYSDSGLSKLKNGI